MNKKRVAIILYGGIGGGIALEGVACLVNLCEKLSQEYDLTVFSLTKVDKSYQPNGYKLIGAPVDDRTGMYYRMAYISIKLASLHYRNKFDLIHAFWGYHGGLLALFWSKLFHIKSIVTFMGGEVANLPSISYGFFQSPLKKRQIQFIAQHVDTVVSLTKNHAQKLQESLQAKRLEVIPFGIDTDLFFDKKLEKSQP